MGYSIWLNFGEPSAGRLKTRIEQIAHRHGCPEFLPHLTLIGDIEAGLEEVRGVAAVFADKGVPPVLRVRSIDHSDRYFMALYLRVDIPPALREARESAARLAGHSACNLDDPHVSLAYGALDPGALEAELESLSLEFLQSDLVVRDISIVHSSKSVPIEQWRRVETITC